jgi:opacity protein-like surface antigen
VPTGATGAVSNLDDYGSLRARAGWILGDFLPYGFVGLAFGQANVNVTANFYAVDELNPTTFIQCAPCTGGGNGIAIYGLTAGLGMDVALTQNIFVRGEFEYVQFFGDVEIAILAARIGVGLKF